jgi:hypothetical protein
MSVMMGMYHATQDCIVAGESKYLSMKGATLDTLGRASTRVCPAMKPVRIKNVSMKICGIFMIPEIQE